MKHYVKPECKHGCRFLLITPALWLCPHASYGEASYLKGAVEEARALLKKLGGYDVVLAKLVADEERKRQEAREEREANRQAPSTVVRYG